MGVDPNEGLRSCEGLVSQGLRALTSEEREWLRLRAERLRRHRPYWIVGAILSPVAFVVSIPLTTFFPEAIGVGLMLFLVVIWSAFMLQARDQFRLAPAIASGEATVAEVFRFDPSLDPQEDEPDGDEEWANQTGGEVEEPFVIGPKEMVRIPESGEVIEIDGRRLARPKVELVYVRVPPAPPPPGPPATRSLTEAELQELEGHAWLGKGLAVRLFVVAHGGVALAALAKGTPKDLVSWLTALTIAAFGLASVWGIYRQLQRTRRLRRDRIAGGVVRAEAGERLPHSGLPWTIQGEPAEWRVRYRPLKDSRSRGILNRGRLGPEA
jgi:hypothetical protein